MYFWLEICGTRINHPLIPSKVTDVKTKKQQLKNDLLHFMEEKELIWPENEVGEVFVQSPTVMILG